MDLELALQNLTKQMFVKYNGRLIEKTANGYILNGKKYTNFEDVKKVINGPERSGSRSNG